jgi:gluconolactonase
VFATCAAGLVDGFRVDEDDRLWSSTAKGGHYFDADGTLIGKSE